MYRCLQSKRVFINKGTAGLNYAIAKQFLEKTDCQIIISGPTQESVDKAIESLKSINNNNVAVTGIVGDFSDRLLTELPEISVMIV